MRKQCVIGNGGVEMVVMIPWLHDSSILNNKYGDKCHG